MQFAVHQEVSDDLTVSEQESEKRVESTDFKCEVPISAKCGELFLTTEPDVTCQTSYLTIKL